MKHLRLKDKTLAARLRSVRSDLFGEFGGARLAESLGIPPETWENYETGVSMPATTLLAFIDLTGVSPHWLLTSEGEKYPEE